MDESNDSNMSLQQEEQMIQQEFKALLADYANTAHKQKVELITRAFEFAKSAHQGVRRKSGEPYIMHPLAVARIVVKEIGLGSTSICSALMHDVVEDTDYTVEDIRERFGDTIAKIVEGLTKISGGQFGEQASKQAENFRRIILTMSDDVRVVLIKIADRLHNMRTLGSMPLAKQLKITGETEYIYAPLAHRLGLFNIKTELENLCFKYEHPDTYKQIADMLAQDQSARLEMVEKFAEPIKNILTEHGYKFKINSRVKTVYSIWRKMTTKNIPFHNIYDLLALRIVFEPFDSNDIKETEKEQCWRVYTLITSIYMPHPQRIRDWISMPKVNGYEALHVTVMGPGGQWMEVQIRTTRMNDIAEKGLAAHWKYKEGSGQNYDTQFDKWLRTIKEKLQNSDTDAIDFVDNFKLDLFKSEIMVFTPKGDSRMMPKGSTVLDFAYSLHTELGHHCIGAKVNHELVPLSYELNPGDQIEILTEETQIPQKDWKKYVTTAHAKECLMQYERKQERIARQAGESIIQETLIKLGREYNHAAVNVLLKKLNLTQPQELLLQVGLGNITAQQLEDLIKPKGNIFTNYIKRFTSNSDEDGNITDDTPKDPLQIIGKTLIVNEENLESHCVLSQCCKPIPGDDTIGFLQNDNTVIIHKRSCPEAVRLKSNSGDKIINIKWDLHENLSFNETIEIRGIDQAKLLSKILDIISLKENINLTELHLTVKDGIFIGRIHLLVQNTQQLNNLCKEIEKIDKIDSVVRVLYDDEVNKIRER